MTRRLFSGLVAYVGQTRSRALVTKLESAGIGECVTRGTLPPRRGRWFYDNGAFEDWRAGRSFDYLQWSRDMRAIRLWQDAEGIPLHRPNGGQSMTAPDFQVLPDLVGAGADSLRFSFEHLDEALASGAPAYLAVQNGMTVRQVARVLEVYPIAGLFVGGTLDWKLETTAAWVELGRRARRPVHVGRVGTVDRVQWAQDLGVTSIDSSAPLWSSAKLDRFLEAVA